MMVPLLAAWAAVNFPGGDWSDLCKSIAESTKKPVVALVGSSETAKPFSYDPEQLNEMARAIAAATGFRMTPGSDMVFHRGRLGAWQFQLAAVQLLLAEDQKAAQGTASGDGAIEGERVTLKHKPGQAGVLGRLDSVCGKALKANWTLERYAFKSWVEGISPREFVDLLAKAAGGKVTETKAQYEIQLDGSEVRRRALNTLDEARKHPKFKDLAELQKSELELAKGAVSDATAAQIAEALATAQGKTRIVIGYGLRSAIQQRIQALLNQPQEVAEEDVNVRGRQPRENRPLGFLRNVDTRLIGYAELNAGFQVRVFLQTVDSLGRPGPMVSLP